MTPPFQVTPKALDIISQTERLLGRMEGLEHSKPQPHLRKSNRIRTVQGSLAIEGNTLSLDQVTALMDGKSVMGKQQEIQEVHNAILLYDQIHEFRPYSINSFLNAHKLMMKGLLSSAGQWRRGNVGITSGTKISHIAPPADRLPYLMKELFEFLKKDKSHDLIKSAVFHYELEFIHPFEDGNGRLGRFWHSRLLVQYHPIFEFTPVESIIKENQEQYYKALSHSDKTGDSTPFVEYALDMVLQALSDLADNLRPSAATFRSRLEGAGDHFGKSHFSRKDYLKLYKSISTATASRDLKSGVELGWLKKEGKQALTVYQFSDT
jgi:Fic family protein